MENKEKGGHTVLYPTIANRRPILEGWSADQKFHVAMQDGQEYLLRISPKEQQERIAGMFLRMEKAARLEIPMCRPIEWGICEEGIYFLQSWVDGRGAEDLLPACSEDVQYAYGLDAGRILKELHSIAAPEAVEPWEQRFNRKIDRKIAMYEACPLKYEGGEAFLRHIARSRHLLTNRPQSYQHGDYHTGNMMIDRQGKLTIIDFEKDDWGDPWEEFNRIVWCAQLSPAFASGMVDGYFGGDVPMDFWNLLALYICSNAVGSLPWAIPYGEQEVATMRNQATEILHWYDHFQTVIPNWYQKRAVR